MSQNNYIISKYNHLLYSLHEDYLDNSGNTDYSLVVNNLINNNNNIKKNIKKCLSLSKKFPVQSNTILCLINDLIIDYFQNNLYKIQSKECCFLYVNIQTCDNSRISKDQFVSFVEKYRDNDFPNFLDEIDYINRLKKEYTTLSHDINNTTPNTNRHKLISEKLKQNKKLLKKYGFIFPDNINNNFLSSDIFIYSIAILSAILIKAIGGLFGIIIIIGIWGIIIDALKKAGK